MTVLWARMFILWCNVYGQAVSVKLVSNAWNLKAAAQRKCCLLGGLSLNHYFYGECGHGSYKLISCGWWNTRCSNEIKVGPVTFWALQIQTSKSKIVEDHWPGTHFTNGVSIAFQIRWKFCFILTSILTKWSLHNFVHDMTAVVLSWHVQKFVAIWWPATKLQQGEGFIEFEMQNR